MINVKAITRHVGSKFRNFGVNKKQEITRLLYEIAKREKIPFKKISEGLPLENYTFADIKKYLIERRFANSITRGEKIKDYLPELNIERRYEVKIRKKITKPKNIYVTEEAKNSFLVSALKKKFPRAKFSSIISFKKYLANKKFGIEDYNRRQENFFIIKEKYDFFKKCPCTSKAVSCGYHILNLGVGCIFECTYCYLQQYINAPGITIPANIEDFFRHFEQYKHNIRLGTGEFTDSLALDDITGFSPLLVDFFRKHPQSTLELKTKSNNVKTLLSSKPAKNVIVAWSLNPQKIIKNNEFYCASLAQRLEAACQCTEAGFDTAFHFDPVFYYEGWERDYEALINELFDKIKDKYIRWISLGTFRFQRELKKIVENRFPQNNILNAELFPSFDLKMRYADSVRLDVYKKMTAWIRKRSRRVLVYLCMEDKSMWDKCKLKFTPTERWN